MSEAGKDGKCGERERERQREKERELDREMKGTRR